MTKFNFKDIEKNQLTKPRSLAWNNWFKFEKIGDMAVGTIVDVFYKKASDGFQDGRGLTLKQEDGALVNVSIKNLEFVLKETDELRLGDPVGIKFTSQGAKVVGKHPAKLFTFFGTKLPENDGQPTVKELYDADKGMGGTDSTTVEADEASTDDFVKALEKTA